MHTSNKHAHLYTYVWTYSYTHKRRSKSCVRLPTHVFHITRSYQQKQIFYIYRVVFFLSRLLSSAKRAPLCRNEWSLQQTNVWWETPPTGATVWVVSHDTWHQYQLYPQTTLDLKLHKVIRRKILFPQTAEWQVEIAKEWECGPAVVQYL